jgi:uncharacterized protein (DUF1778 family)
MELHMTTNDPDSEALLLDQTYFALDAEGFAMFQGLVDNPPSATTRLRRMLTSPSPWSASATGMSKSTPEL